MATSKAFGGAVLVLVGIFLIAFPQNVGGYTLQNNGTGNIQFPVSGGCNPVSITALSGTPNPIGGGQNLAITGVFNQAGNSCGASSGFIYFWYTNPVGGTISTGLSTYTCSTATPRVCPFVESLLMPTPTSQTTITISASICPQNNQAGCIAAAFSNGALSETVQATIVTTYSISLQFIDASNNLGINGMSVQLLQSGNVIATVVSANSGFAIFNQVLAGTYSYSYSCQSCSSSGGPYPTGSGGPVTVPPNYAATLRLSASSALYRTQLQFLANSQNGSPLGSLNVRISNGTQLLFNVATNSTGWVNLFGFTNGNYLYATSASGNILASNGGFTISGASLVEHFVVPTTTSTSTTTVQSSSSYTTQSSGSTTVGAGQNNWITITLPSSGVLWVNFVANGAGIKLWILSANQFGTFEATCGFGSSCTAPGGDLVGTGVTNAGNYSATITAAGTYYIDFDGSGCVLNCLLSQGVTYQLGFASSASNCILGILCSGGTGGLGAIIAQISPWTGYILIGVGAVVLIRSKK